MSIPGLDQDEPLQGQYGVETVQQSKTVELHKESEWRFEVNLTRTVIVKITTGTAELYGSELVLNKPYTFQGTKAAIYTWTGCTLEISDATALLSEYVASETTATESLNLHFALEALRDRSLAPRVLLLGPENVGKTTLAKTLTAYAIRAGRAPVVVNLDPRESVLSVPGTISCAVFRSLLEVEADAGGGWGTSPMSGPNGEIPVKMPLVYYHGGGQGTKEKILFRAQSARLGLAVQGRGGDESGVIVDTPGWLVRDEEMIKHVVGEFAVNVIVVLGSERVYNDMVKRFDKQSIRGQLVTVVKVPKSEGCVDRDVGYFKAMNEAQIRGYFYGNVKVGAGVGLQPRMQTVEFDALPTLWRRVGEKVEEEGFLPGGVDDEYEPSVPLGEGQLFERMQPTKAMSNCLVGILNCVPEAEGNVLRDSSCMGFLYVTDVDVEKRKLSVLSPVAGRVPNRALVWSQGMEPVLGVVT